VSPSFRTAINVPQNIWPKFREKLQAMGASLLNNDNKQDSAAAADDDDERCIKQESDWSVNEDVSIDL